MRSCGSYIGFIQVRDRAVARCFYEDTLGLQVRADTPFALVLDSGGTMIRVTAVADFTAAGYTVAGWKADDIEAAVTSLRDSGVEITLYEEMDQDHLGIWASPSGDRVAWFRDPDGNTLSLTQFVD